MREIRVHKNDVAERERGRGEERDTQKKNTKPLLMALADLERDQSSTGPPPPTKSPQK